jgi:Ca2+-binding EF-hand superfamily protein
VCARQTPTHALTDHSGELSFEEVRELLPTLDVDAKTDEEVFAISFSRLCLARALSSSPPLQVRRVMNRLDTDGSGTISFEEFVNLLFCLIYGVGLE